jgi:hypothetical protein
VNTHHTNIVSSPNDVSPNESFTTVRPSDDLSLGRCVLRTMHPVDDASFGRCVLWTMRPLDDASFGRCVLWTMRPLEDASCGRCVLCTMRPWPTCPVFGPHTGGWVSEQLHTQIPKFAHLTRHVGRIKNWQLAIAQGTHYHRDESFSEKRSVTYPWETDKPCT